MRKIVKRIAAAASAVVIGGVSCVTTWFSVPASAAAGVGWLEWMEFQALLQGIGIGGNNSDFADSVQNWINGIGGAELPRDDYDGEWMTNYEYYNRLGWDEIIGFFDNLADSWTEDYSSIPDVGTDVSGGGFIPGALSSDGKIYRLSAESAYSTPLLLWSGNVVGSDGEISPTKSSVSLISYGLGESDCYFVLKDGTLYCVSSYNKIVKFSFGCTGQWTVDLSSGNGYYYFGDNSTNYAYQYSSYPASMFHGTNVLPYFLSCAGIHLVDIGNDSVRDYFLNINDVNFSDLATSDGFIGPVYTYPAAQELYKSTGTAAGIRLDVQTQDGVPDVQAALDGAGVETVDDLVAGVAAGTVPMSKVLSDAKVTPYVVADTTAGTVVTDLGVSATATGVKAVGLTQDLAVPKDLTNAATYVIKGKTWDPEMSKYNLPLFQYFPFCLPWDIYQVLAAFSADPVAPVFDIPVGKILSGVRSADVSKAASLSAKIDFGDDNWSKVFEVIRILECAGIIVGLCLVAVYLIHGGR